MATKAATKAGTKGAAKAGTKAATKAATKIRAHGQRPCPGDHTTKYTEDTK